MAYDYARPINVIAPELVSALAMAQADLARPVVYFTTATISTSEGNSGTKSLTLTARRSSIAGTLNVTGSYVPGTAGAADFPDGLPGDKVWAFPDGSDTATVTITVKGDADFESDETFGYQLQGGSGYRLGTPSAVTVTITNDDSSSPQPITVTPAPAAYSDSFVGDGALNTRPNWSVPSGEEGRWGTTGGSLYYKQQYGPLSRATFGTDLPDQDILIEYNTSGDAESGWDVDQTFYDLLVTDPQNFLRARWAKGIPTITINPVIAGNEGSGIVFTGYGGVQSDKGTVLFRIAGGTIRVAVNGVWATTIANTFNFPLDRAALSRLGGSSAPTHGKVAIEARTWRYARADAISQTPAVITLDADDEFVGRDSPTATGGTWTGTGTYVGTPTQWAVRVVTGNGSVVSDWAAPKSITASGGVFTMTAFLPLGGAYTVEAAWIGSDGLAHIARSRPVLSGYNVVYYGQSNSSGRNGIDDSIPRGPRWASDVPSAANQDNAFPAGHWASTLTNFRPTAGQGVGQVAAPLLNVPVSVMIGGSPGTGLDFLKPGGLGFTAFTNLVANLRGIIEVVVWDQGENDGDNDNPTVDYVAKFRDDLLPGLRTVGKNPGLKVLIAPPGNYPNPAFPNAFISSQAKFNAGRDFIRKAFQTLVDTVPGVSWASFKLGADHSGDAYHYPVSVMYNPLCLRDGLSVAKALGASTYDGRGPLVTGASRSGATITLALDLNGAASVSGPVAYNTFSAGTRGPVPANSFKGYEVSADNFATNLPISGIAVSGNSLVITLASAPSGAVKVRSMAGANYDDTSLFVGNYPSGTTGLMTIPVAPIINPLTA